MTANTDDAGRRVEDIHMGLACAFAYNGSKRKIGGPFGAVIVMDDVVVAGAHNTVLKDQVPTRHAEMNAIRIASKVLQASEMGRCQIYTTCEPCPMCWGGILKAGIRYVFVGVDADSAAKFGWDDRSFHKETGLPYSERMLQIRSLKSEKLHGIKQDIKVLYKNSTGVLTSVPTDVCPRSARVKNDTGVNEERPSSAKHKVRAEQSDFGIMEGLRESKHPHCASLLKVAKEIGEASEDGLPFGAVVADNGGNIIATAANEQTARRDPTCTAEVLAVERACRTTGRLSLQDCTIYCTSEPDIMSLGAILWARISKVVVGISLREAAEHGHYDALLSYTKKFESCVDNTDLPDGERVFITRGVQYDRCLKIFKDYAEEHGTLY